MAGVSQQNQANAKWTMSTGGWDTERWVAVVVLFALGMLIAIRMGFRGIDVGGVRVGVS